MYKTTLMAFLTTIGSYIGSFFTADAGAAAGAGAAGSTAAGADVAATAATAATADTAATAALSTSAAAGTAGAALPAATATTATAATGGSIATTVSEASAIASGASALYTLSQGSPRINIPPAPVNQGQVDISQANAEQQQLARREAAGGLQGTTGTPGGQAGAILNPSTMSNHSILGG